VVDHLGLAGTVDGYGDHGMESGDHPVNRTIAMIHFSPIID